MKLKYEAGLFVIEPQTTAENEVLKMLATDETSQAGSSTKGVMLGAPSGALPWECAVADALGAHLEGMSCESVSRVLRELQRMNAASVSGAFDTPARASPSLPAQEESSDVKEPPQKGIPGSAGSSFDTPVTLADSVSSPRVSKDNDDTRNLSVSPASSESASDSAASMASTDAALSFDGDVKDGNIKSISKHELVRLFERLALVFPFNVQLSENRDVADAELVATAEVYANLLAEFPAEKVRRAFVDCAQLLNRFPYPADLIGCISGSGGDREPALSSQGLPGGKSCHRESDSTSPQGSSRTQAGRLNLIHQVFERCSRLGLRPPSLLDLDDFLDGRTSVMPPEDNALNRVLNFRRTGEPNELLYDLHGPNGERWKIHLNGAFEGFPPGTFIANYALPLVDAMIGEMKKHGIAFTVQ